MDAPNTPKTSRELGEQIVRISIGIVALSQPTTKESLETIVKMATVMSEALIDGYVSRVLESSRTATEEVLKDK